MTGVQTCALPIFDFYFNAGITSASTDLLQQNKLASAWAGVKAFQVESYDGSSLASGSINMKYYTWLDPSILNPTTPLNTTSGSTSATAGSTATTVTTPTVNTAAVAAATSINNAIDNTNVTTVDITGVGNFSWINGFNFNLPF